MNESATTNSLDERIKNALALALQLSPDLITPDLSFGDLPQWDSMGHMEVMMRLEEFFGIEINADTIASLTSVAAIRAYLDNSKKEA
ncbi:MAG: acyl carrier protein [Anaerolineales bacterium]